MKKNHLTVIFMKDTNRPLTYEISIRLLIAVLVIFVGSASTYAFFIKGYYSLYKDNEKLEEIIRDLKIEIGGLQGTINQLKIAKTETVPEPSIEAVQPQKNEEKAQSTAKEVTIRELKLSEDKESGNLNFSFVLDKIEDNEQMMRGYLFVVLKNKDKHKINSFPEASFNGSIPADFRHGDRYAIRRFKGYRGELKLANEAIEVEILVYSDNGDLLARLTRRLS